MIQIDGLRPTTIINIRLLIMEREQQDKLWNGLSEEQKQEYINWYKGSGSIEPLSEFDKGNLYGAELIFGEHNLNHQKIRTWEDVEKYYPVYKIDKPFINVCVSDILYNKLVATYKIQILIELGYGSKITENEWKEKREKYTIVVYCDEGKYVLEKGTTVGYKQSLAFHTEQQRDEFMSYSENVELIKQYNLL